MVRSELGGCLFFPLFQVKIYYSQDALYLGYYLILHFFQETKTSFQKKKCNFN